MKHQETYRQNQAYTEFLAGWDERFYAKYADCLCSVARPGSRILDVGCGVGQVMRRVAASGFEAYGVEVSETSITKVRAWGGRGQVYDGRRIPFPDNFFSAAGALNVLEHVDEPEAFIAELVRVVEEGGRVVLSSPNFFRVLGWRDYHPHMRGVRQKWSNLQRLLAKWRQTKASPNEVRFDRLAPIVKVPFTPDDDAVVATNGIEMAFFLRRAGCLIERSVCTDRYVNPILDWFINVTPLRYCMLNAFLVARRAEMKCCGSRGRRGGNGH